MNLAEKIEKELKEVERKGLLPLPKVWSLGFRFGFRRGYVLAYKEANQRLKRILGEIKKKHGTSF